MNVEVLYSDGDANSFDMMMVMNKKKWINNSNAKITMGIDPFKEVKYLEVGDFKRTPQTVNLNISFTAINIDKEIPFECKIDLLPMWKEFQTKEGLR